MYLTECLQIDLLGCDVFKGVSQSSYQCYQFFLSMLCLQLKHEQFLFIVPMINIFPKKFLISASWTCCFGSYCSSSM